MKRTLKLFPLLKLVAITLATAQPITNTVGAINAPKLWQLVHTDKLVEDISKLPPAREWITVEQPTSVPMALFKAGKLPNPYIGQNIKQYEWITNKTWYYKKSFTIQKPADKSYIFLSFDGVDYFSRIWLNGKYLGDTKAR